MSSFFFNDLSANEPVGADLRRVDGSRNSGPGRFQNLPDAVIKLSGAFGGQDTCCF